MRSESTPAIAEPLDEELLAATARGDLDAFQAFYQRYAGRVLAYARRTGRDAALAEDVTQEVFTAVWTRAATFRPDRGDAPAWLYTLTRNKLVDHWRKLGRDREMETIEDLTVPAPVSEDRDLRLTLRQALSRVAPEQREAIEMAYYGGLTYEETAGRLALPVGTLKSRIRVGLRALRTVLGEGGLPELAT
ncbi:MAG TPA: sigma-70 family RNA polymerase sigma factor [Thermoanaerobaculia bacterium]|jgi:RNA polymerase sigma-70 factor (ECF subfamily)|nr:sigma-70 family RNA polymerase sigma factor [Thermoanaerobaculia bacterium]